MREKIAVAIAPCEQLFTPVVSHHTFGCISVEPLFLPTNEVCEGYVFTPVCHSVHRGVGSAQVHAGMHTPQEQIPQDQTSPWEQTPALGADSPLGADPLAAGGYCCRRYASHWNAFLFLQSKYKQVKCYPEFICLLLL